jgi:hypothetical protein
MCIAMTRRRRGFGDGQIDRGSGHRCSPEVENSRYCLDEVQQVNAIVAAMPMEPQINSANENLIANGHKLLIQSVFDYAIYMLGPSGVIL